MDPGVIDETLTVQAELRRARNEVIRFAITGTNWEDVYQYDCENK